MYDPSSLPEDHFAAREGYPGAFPYTRGVYPSMYRDKLWTMRQFSGFATPEVYGWARNQGESRVMVIKGDSRGAAPVSQPSPVDVGPYGKRIRSGVRVWPVNGGMVKEELFRWLRLDKPTEESGAPYPPGYCHFPNYGEELAHLYPLFFHSGFVSEKRLNHPKNSDHLRQEL